MTKMKARIKIVRDFADLKKVADFFRRYMETENVRIL
jgi:hypothetical protein